MSKDPELLIIVPSRGRPQSLQRMVTAWHDTGAFEQGAMLVFAVDHDDPEFRAYEDAYQGAYRPGLALSLNVSIRWQQMVPKLNLVATQYAKLVRGVFALGFAGDDHVPRTPGWARRYLEELYSMGTGIVYGDDLLKGASLPTQWAMTSNIVRLFGRMPTVSAGRGDRAHACVRREGRR